MTRKILFPPLRSSIENANSLMAPHLFMLSSTMSHFVQSFYHCLLYFILKLCFSADFTAVK